MKALTAEYRRARRNLVFMSAVLISMKYGGMTVEEFSILGIQAKLANPNSVFVLVWIVWLYFAMSFIQYFNQEDREKLAAAWNHAVTFTCGYKMADLIKDEYPSWKLQRPLEYAHLKKDKVFRPVYNTRDIVSPTGSHQIEETEFQI